MEKSKKILFWGMILFLSSCNLQEDTEVYCGEVRYKYPTYEGGKHVYYKIVYFPELNKELHIAVKPSVYNTEQDTACFELTETQTKSW
jgi:hypothetical protein